MKTVILTNEKGEHLGTVDRREAHANEGMLHKAFSVFVFSHASSKLLIQRRAREKLFGNLWANTCCSHPREKLPIENEAENRLEEECGFRCPLTVHSSFVYQASDPEGKGIEHEYDTILIGEADETVQLHPDPGEIAEMQWINVSELKEAMQSEPNAYAPWFHQALELIME